MDGNIVHFETVLSRGCSYYSSVFDAIDLLAEAAWMHHHRIGVPALELESVMRFVYVATPPPELVVSDNGRRAHCEAVSDRAKLGERFPLEDSLGRRCCADQVAYSKTYFEQLRSMLFSADAAYGHADRIDCVDLRLCYFGRLVSLAWTPTGFDSESKQVEVLLLAFPIFSLQWLEKHIPRGIRRAWRPLPCQKPASTPCVFLGTKCRLRCCPNSSRY